MKAQLKYADKRGAAIALSKAPMSAPAAK